MKTLFFISIVTLMCNYTKGQYQDINWCFGDSIGLNFSGDTVSFFETGITGNRYYANISDNDGNLLFYTNGNKVWNKEHNIMQNGSYLLGLWSGYTTSMFPIIIPQPNNSTTYYLFHGNEPVYYSIIDMSYNDGIGKVVEKNKLLENTWPNNATHKLSTVKHGNGRDFWVIFPSTYFDWDDESYGLPTLYHRLLITPDGIIQEPTIEGEIFNEEDFGYHLGQSKFSPDGTLYGVTCGEKVWLYYFDRCSGELVHYYTIDSIWAGDSDDYVDGLEFSPNGSKLYLTKRGNSTGISSRLYQYDLNADNIKASQIILQQNNSNYEYAHLQLAPNGKIYCAMPADGPEYYSYDEPQNLSLSVIHNPNEAGEACNYEHLGQYMYGKKITLGLPNMPNYNLGVLPKSACDTLSTSITEIKTNTDFQLFPNPVSSAFYIKSKNASANTYSLSITDVMHTEVMVLNNYISGNAVRADDLPQGIYIVTLKDDEQVVFLEKMLIMK